MADPVVLDRWDATDVRLSDVLNALSELRRSSPRNATGTACSSLIAIASNDEEAYRALQAMRRLGVQHPARFVLVRQELSDLDAVGGIDAKVTLYGGMAGEHPVTFSDITLVVRGRAAEHLDFMIEPFTLPDLPVVVWYPGALPPVSEPLLRMAHAVLVDTKEAGDPQVLTDLIMLAGRRVVVDLSWARLRPWRELLAALFDGPDYLPFASGVTSIEMYGKPTPRHLLAGWLSSRLSVPRTHVHLHDARHVSVRIMASSGGRQARFAALRSGEEHLVRASATIEGGPSHQELLPLPDDSLASSLSHALGHLDRDPVWEAAIGTAVSLATATAV
ncbi:MAG TPA: glucose-6-phosphate dehydrogenase assembly protein OpcA [Acidimicrobiales bacterium]